MNQTNTVVKRIVLIVLAGVMVLGTFLIIRNWSQRGISKVMPKVTIAASKNPWTSLVLIADKQGFFADEGLDLSIAYQDGGRYCMDALMAKSAEFATIVEVNVAYLGFTENKNVKVVASIVESTSTGIIARKSAGIERPEDLRGKILAYSPGTGSELFAIRFLEKHGIQPDEVEMRKMQPKAIQGAMVAKEVDAACTWDPFIENSRYTLGADAITFFDSDAYLGYMHVAVRTDWASKHREEVFAFLRALKRAEEFVVANPSAAQTIVAERTAMKLDLVKSVWPLFRFGLFMDPKNGAGTAEGVASLIKKNNPDFSDKPIPDYSEYFDDQFFREAIQK